MSFQEYNFDGLIGPTHNYAGLSFGNVASTTHQNQVSQPRAAAIQGLEKMKLVSDLVGGQCLLPPFSRPDFRALRKIGFRGSEEEMVVAAHQRSPALLASFCSAATMWTANAATVAPTNDTPDGKLHFSPANLASTFHRSFDHRGVTEVMKFLFADSENFCVHDALPGSLGMSDEGAANHTRLSAQHGDPGLHVFVFGFDPFNRSLDTPKNFPARQSLQASRMITQRHGLVDAQCMFVQQTAQSIDAGVFHNDVISVGNENVFLCHELAFVDQADVLNEMRQRAKDWTRPLCIVEFSNEELPLEHAVKSYLFNSQLVTRGDGKMTLICPLEVEETSSAHQAALRIVAEDNPVDEVRFLDLRQSMNNGGGPACLRLRVVMNQHQAAAMHQGVVLTDGLYEQLKSWIIANYREELSSAELCDPKLFEESRGAMGELEKILGLPSGILISDA